MKKNHTCKPLDKITLPSFIVIRLISIRVINETNGYANIFKELITHIMNILPSNEVITSALRKEIPIYPEVAIRGLVANVLIHQDFTDMNKEDKIRACYLHACLKRVRNDFLTNASLRGRFKIKESNSSIISKIINDTLKEGLINQYGDSTSRKFKKYAPYWI